MIDGNSLGNYVAWETLKRLLWVFAFGFFAGVGIVTCAVVLIWL